MQSLVQLFKIAFLNQIRDVAPNVVVIGVFVAVGEAEMIGRETPIFPDGFVNFLIRGTTLDDRRTSAECQFPKSASCNLYHGRQKLSHRQDVTHSRSYNGKIRAKKTKKANIGINAENILRPNQKLTCAMSDQSPNSTTEVTHV